MADTDPITREEMVALFNSEMPIEAVKLIWESPPETTFAEIRAKLRAIAASRTLEERIARTIFANLTDIDGDEADWMYYREQLQAAAKEIIAKYVNGQPMKEER